MSLVPQRSFTILRQECCPKFSSRVYPELSLEIFSLQIYQESGMEAIEGLSRGVMK